VGQDGRRRFLRGGVKCLLTRSVAPDSHFLEKWRVAVRGIGSATICHFRVAPSCRAQNKGLTKKVSHLGPLCRTLCRTPHFHPVSHLSRVCRTPVSHPPRPGQTIETSRIKGIGGVSEPSLRANGASCSMGARNETARIVRQPLGRQERPIFVVLPQFVHAGHRNRVASSWEWIRLFR
jgi:hypothetical protein